MLTVLGVILLVCALFLIVAVMMQQGKSKNLSGAITGGGSETFFGKTKGSTVDKMLSKITSIVAVVFVLLVIVVYAVQDSAIAQEEAKKFGDVKPNISDVVDNETEGTTDNAAVTDDAGTETAALETEA